MKGGSKEEEEEERRRKKYEYGCECFEEYKRGLKSRIERLVWFKQEEYHAKRKKKK